MTVRRPRVRAEIQLLDGGGFRHYFATLQEAIAWLASPAFMNGDVDKVRSVHLSITRAHLLRSGNGQAPDRRAAGAPFRPESS